MCDLGGDWLQMVIHGVVATCIVKSESESEMLPVPS